MKKTELYQLTPNKNVLMQCNVIKTANDKIIVVDGGYYGAEYCYYIHSAIRAILGLDDGDYFEIEAWILTHAHEDHFGEIGLQFERYSKQSNFKVNSIYFDFDDLDSHKYDDDCQATRKYLDGFKKALDNYANVNEIAFNGSYYNTLNGAFINQKAIDDGVKLKIDNVEFEFLQTWAKEDKIINSSSLVTKMSVFEGDKIIKTVMFLGDTSLESGERLIENVPVEKLKSDIVQMAHHGNWACDKTVYDKIGAKIRLWPTPLWVWTCNDKRFDIDMVRGWFNVKDKSQTDIVSCLYEEYPEDRESVSDWKKVLGGMKIDL